jgi:hypothetical protein
VADLSERTWGEYREAIKAMKSFIITMLAVALFTPTLIAQETGGPWANKFFLPDIATNPKQTAPPVLVHDFGTHPKGTILTHRMPITNIYGVPIEIRQPSVTCGCVKPSITRQVIQPLETANLNLVMDLREVSGAKAVNVYVTFAGERQQFQSTAIIQVKAFSRTDVLINPGQIDFLTVGMGQQVTRTADVIYSGNMGRNWAIESAVADGIPIDVTVQKVPDRNYNIHRVTATVQANAASGRFQGQIVLKTNDPNTPWLTIQTFGGIQAALTASPKEIRWPALTVGRAANQAVVIQGNGTPFKIIKVDGEGDGILVRRQADSREVQIVTIFFTPSKVGDFKRELTFYTDRGTVVKIPIETVVEP